jgi:cytochrome c biogenesis protein ResB
VRSASPRITRVRGGVLALVCCLALFGGALAGCQTTQETAALRQARAKRILKERELRRERRKKDDNRGGSEKHDR